ncbi:MAG: TonB-dependent receptor plug domain-containing protein [Desulfosalsimonadaceae bacterium]|nr:TonB-dependent receptor plug domain-containing protein [Desulfosalsimonadaceae bacterium]
MIQQVLKILVAGMMIGCFLSPPPARSSDREDTLLMFVGEELDVLSIASRREESARQAPAVATVVTRDMIEQRGIFTLSEALDQTPGFYMAQQEWGSRPYLRGVPDSILFLYDTVPMTSDITKSVHPLDEELSLAPVKRIEIIRGPGSVLWGPDAFAGIVNVVPMTGKDLNGVETGAHYSAPGDGRGAYVNAGHDGGVWDGFLSLNAREDEADDRAGNIVQFWGDGSGAPVPPEDRYGIADADRPYFLELVGNANFRDWATLSGRYSDYSLPYAMADEDQEQVWIENRSTPVNYLKLESKKDVGLDAAMRFTGYYSSVNADQEVIDLSLSPNERTAYTELIYDQNLLSGKGLLTAGTAYRNTQVADAPVWDSYLPGYLVPENETFLPRITEVDYRSELWSVFGQYSHKIGKTDVSFGLRHDAHDFYDDSLSYNCGIVWSPTTEWGVKLLYGSAYRTPYTSQLLEKQDAGFEDIETRLEEINTVNTEVSWRPGPRFGLSLGGFVNHISNHVMENAYAGLSDPNSQKIYGLELEGMVSPVERLEFSANLTATRNTGPDEVYRYADGIIIDPDDGSIDTNYTELSYPFDTGPDRLVNFMVQWKPIDRVSLFCRTGYRASIDMVCPTCVTAESTPGVWLTDMAATFRDIGVFGLDAGVYLNNVTDRDYQIPGTYSLIDGEPFSVRVLLKKRW